MCAACGVLASSCPAVTWALGSGCGVRRGTETPDCACVGEGLHGVFRQGPVGTASVSLRPGVGSAGEGPAGAGTAWEASGTVTPLSAWASGSVCLGLPLPSLAARPTIGCVPSEQVRSPTPAVLSSETQLLGGPPHPPSAVVRLPPPPPVPCPHTCSSRLCPAPSLHPRTVHPRPGLTPQLLPGAAVWPSVRRPCRKRRNSTAHGRRRPHRDTRGAVATPGRPGALVPGASPPSPQTKTHALAPTLFIRTASHCAAFFHSSVKIDKIEFCGDSRAFFF